jgi:chaperonin GroES
MENKITATNNAVFIIRDETQTQKNGLFIPDSGKTKQHTGKVCSIGSLVEDKAIKSSTGKKVMFHAGIGFEIEYEGVTYLVLQGNEIIAVL